MNDDLLTTVCAIIFIILVIGLIIYAIIDKVKRFKQNLESGIKEVERNISTALDNTDNLDTAKKNEIKDNMKNIEETVDKIL